MSDEKKFEQGMDIGSFVRENWDAQDRTILFSGLGTGTIEDRFVADMVASKPNCAKCVHEFGYLIEKHTAGTEQHSDQGQAEAQDWADKALRDRATAEFLELLDITDDEPAEASQSFAQRGYCCVQGEDRDCYERANCNDPTVGELSGTHYSCGMCKNGCGFPKHNCQC